MMSETAVDTSNEMLSQNLEEAEEAYEHEETVIDGKEDSEEDVDEMLANELALLKESFPELSAVSDITEIKNPLRYAALRDLGLSATEAYLAARGPVQMNDNRSHLSASAPKVMGRGVSMPKDELMRAREIFYGMSDSEIQRLWRKVTK